MAYIYPRKGKRHSTFKKIFKSTIVIECIKSSLWSPDTEECQFSKSPCEHILFISMKNLPEAQSLLRLNQKKNWDIPDWAKTFSLSTSFATWETWFSMLYKLILGRHLGFIWIMYSYIIAHPLPPIPLPTLSNIFLPAWFLKLLRTYISSLRKQNLFPGKFGALWKPNKSKILRESWDQKSQFVLITFLLFLGLLADGLWFIWGGDHWNPKKMGAIGMELSTGA